MKTNVFVVRVYIIGLVLAAAVATDSGADSVYFESAGSSAFGHDTADSGFSLMLFVGPWPEGDPLGCDSALDDEAGYGMYAVGMTVVVLDNGAGAMGAMR